MGLLGKTCRRLLKRWSRGYNRAATVPLQANTSRCSSCDLDSVQGSREMLTDDSTTAARGACVAMQEARDDDWTTGCFVRETVVNVTPGCELEVGRVAGPELLPSMAAKSVVHALPSESDSGVCLDENELLEDVVSECGDVDFECECECDECAFARWEDVLQDWHIPAKDLTLDKVLSNQRGETVYSGNWHGSISVHQRQSTQQMVLNFYIKEAYTLSKIRHENIQLFLGVCLDLGCDSVSLVMSDIKGESLHTLLHRRNREFTFSAMTKYINQIAQGMAYLHDRGIAHPLLTSKCISIHYRACISMLSPAFSSNSVEPSQLVYLPPEVIRTLRYTALPPAGNDHYNTRHSLPPKLTTDHANQDSTDANIFSFGTVVYEMVTMSRAFPNTPGELIIWEVGNNRCQSLQHMHNGKLKDVIQRCWYPNPNTRPSFKELLGTLEQNMSPRACGLTSYFSFSDPGQLARTGLR